MNHYSKIQTKNLNHKLRSLDIDEGIRIESSTKSKKIFVNKNASGTFVVQCINKNYHDNYNKSIRYVDSAKEILELVKSSFGNKFSVWTY